MINTKNILKHFLPILQQRKEKDQVLKNILNPGNRSLGGNHSGAQPSEKFLERSRTLTDSQSVRLYNIELHRN